MNSKPGLPKDRRIRNDRDRQITSRDFWDVANLVTLIGLTAAVGCALLAIKGQIAFAIVALMVSGVCDLFDGFVARRVTRNERQREFGGHLDTIVDACSFGFAPVVLVYAAGLNSVLEIPFLIFFSLSVVWRLAYFETVGLQGEGPIRYFVGLPVTYVAMFLPLAFLAGFWGPNSLRVSLCVAVVALAILMISAFPIRKPSGLFYLIFPLSGVALATVFISFADRFAM